MKNPAKTVGFGFVGRAAELSQLSRIGLSKRAAIVIVYGRRRVGNTTLIQHAYSNGHFALAMQLRRFGQIVALRANLSNATMKCARFESHSILSSLRNLKLSLLKTGLRVKGNDDRGYDAFFSKRFAFALWLICSGNSLGPDLARKPHR